MIRIGSVTPQPGILTSRLSAAAKRCGDQGSADFWGNGESLTVRRQGRPRTAQASSSAGLLVRLACSLAWLFVRPASRCGSALHGKRSAVNGQRSATRGTGAAAETSGDATIPTPSRRHCRPAARGEVRRRGLPSCETTPAHPLPTEFETRAKPGRRRETSNESTPRENVCRR